MVRLYVAGENAVSVIEDGRVETGLEGRGARCLALDPKDPDALYVGTSDEGIFKSEDGGGTWEKLSGIKHPMVTAVAVSPTAGAVYAGTEPSALFVSRNGGESWRELEGMRNLPSAPTQPGLDPTVLYYGHGISSGYIQSCHGVTSFFSRSSRYLMLLKQLLQVLFQVVCGYAVFRGVCDGLLAEVVEGQGTCRGKPPAPGMFEDEPHQLQGDLGLALALLHTDASLRAVLCRELYRRSGRLW